MAQHGPNFTARPTLRISLGAIKSNYQALQKRIGDVKIGASLKADAYGLGATRVGRALFGAGCRNFFVATAGEGKALREAIGDGASIYVLNGPAPMDLTLFFGSRLKPVINSLVQANIWREATQNVKHVPYSVLHLDTGINRLGFSSAEFDQLRANKPLLKSLNVGMVMSHLACSALQDHPKNAEQLKLFRAQSSRLPVVPLSLSNTAGIYLGKKYHFQMVRPGIGLYGGKATDNPANEVSQPVVSLMAPILQIRDLMPGETVGYNAMYEARSKTTIAIVGAGYADGIPVSSSGTNEKLSAHGLLQKKRIPIIGRVSMDLTALDVSALKKKPRIGDWVEFRGNHLEDDASQLGTLNYELLTRLGQRCRRVYLD